MGGEPRAVTISSAREKVYMFTSKARQSYEVNDLVTPHPWLSSRQEKAEQSSGGDPELMCKAPAASFSRSPSLSGQNRRKRLPGPGLAHSQRSSGVWVGENEALRKETTGIERRSWEYRRVP